MADTHQSFVVPVSEQRFESVAQSINDAVLSVDSTSRIVFWNAGAQRVFGYNEGEALGSSLMDLMPERFRDAHRAGMARLVATGEARVIGQTVELAAVRKDGSEFPMELSLGRFEIGGDQFFTGVIRDISDRKRAERYRATQHAVTMILAEAPPLDEALPRVLEALGTNMGWQIGGFWEVDGAALHCRAVWHSEGLDTSRFEAGTRDLSLARGIGLPGRVWDSGRPLWLLDVTEDPNYPRAPLAAEIGLHAAVGIPVLANGDGIGVVEFYTSALREPDDELIEMMHTLSTQLGIFLERKRAERRLTETAAELARSNAELEQFATVASHDLQEPLRKIQMFSQMLEQAEVGQLSDRGRDYTRRMAAAAARMQSLIDDLLALSRVTTQTGPRVTVDLEQLAHQVVSDLEASIAEAGASLTIGPDLPTVRADPRQMTQMLQNLLSNAIKFRRDGVTPEIRLSGEVRPGRALICVEDNGTGFDPRHAQRVFAVFERLHPRSYPGTGIGLAIVKRIVDQLGGSIEVESEPGRGTTFRVELPA